MGCVLHLLSKKFKMTLYLEASYAFDRTIAFTVANRWHSKAGQSRFRTLTENISSEWLYQCGNKAMRGQSY